MSLPGVTAVLLGALELGSLSMAAQTRMIEPSTSSRGASRGLNECARYLRTLAIEHMVRTCKSDRPEALYALGHFLRRHPVPVERLARMVDTANGRQTTAAVYALRFCGSDEVPQAIRVATSSFANDDIDVANIALSSLAFLTYRNSQAIFAMTQSAQEDDLLLAPRLVANADLQCQKEIFQLLRQAKSLADDEPHRVCRARCLAALDYRCEQVSDALVKLAADRSGNVRSRAIMGLAYHRRWFSANARRSLLAALSDNDIEVAKAAAYVIGNMEHCPPELQAALLRVAGDARAPHRLDALLAMSSRSTPFKEVGPILEKALQGEKTRRVAAEMLAKVDHQSLGCVDQLRLLMKDETCSCAVIRAIAAFPSRVEKCKKALLAEFERRRGIERYRTETSYIILALGGMPEPTDETLALLKKLIDDKEPMFRFAAAAALLRLGKYTQEAVECLADNLDNGGNGRATEYLFQHIRFEALEPVILSALSHESDSVRWRALFGLCSVPTVSRKVLARVGRSIVHDQGIKKWYGAEVLFRNRAIEEPTLIAMLLGDLQSPDPNVRYTAIEWMLENLSSFRFSNESLQRFLALETDPRISQFIIMRERGLERKPSCTTKTKR